MTKLEPLVVTGELIFLTAPERIQFYVQNCDALGLDFRTRPLQFFEQVDRNGRRNLILYALRGASVQLSSKHHLTVSLSKAEFSHDAVMFTATVRSQQGREDSAVGATSLKGLEGKEYADAIMAAQTKAKRRAILDFVGSGLLDESEVEGMKGSVIEVTEADLKDYVPIAATPAPATAEAPATEVIAEDYGNIPKSIHDAANALTARLAETMKPLFAAAEEEEKAAVKSTVQAPEQNQLTEAEITSRLNSYRRDTLQQGGMRPSKGFGIAAKWAKFLSKRAPGKSIAEYVEVLKRLDTIFKAEGASGVVAKIEAEIAA